MMGRISLVKEEEVEAVEVFCSDGTSYTALVIIVAGGRGGSCVCLG